MLLASLLALGLSGPTCAEAPSGFRADSLERLYQGGQRYAEFLEGVKARRETWLDNTRTASVDSGLLARARAVPGEWKLLVVAEDWCGDSANTLPFVAHLTDSLPGVSLRIVNSTAGRWVMERYRTPDGRAATPTIVLLDGAGEAAGCWVERPAALREALAASPGGSREAVLSEWRRKDQGRSAMLEIVELMEAAAQRTGRCVPGS